MFAGFCIVNLVKAWRYNHQPISIVLEERDQNVVQRPTLIAICQSNLRSTLEFWQGQRDRKQDPSRLCSNRNVRIQFTRSKSRSSWLTVSQRVPTQKKSFLTTTDGEPSGVVLFWNHRTDWLLTKSTIWASKQRNSDGDLWWWNRVANLNLVAISFGTGSFKDKPAKRN